jgi:PPP family 3-phenylpropionic acid transporter
MVDGASAGSAILAFVLSAAIVLLAACIAMPEIPTAAPAGRSRWMALGRLTADRYFWLFIVSAAMLQASHQLYYGFGTLYWRSLGFSPFAIGALWAEGVVAEIALFWYSAPLVARIGPLGLMALGGGAGIVRWSLTGLLPGIIPAAGLKSLHALTFGATHFGAMHFLARRVPPGAASSGQSLYSALSAGLGSGLVMLIAGPLYAAYGGYAYSYMAMLSAVGLGGVLWL